MDTVTTRRTVEDYAAELRQAAEPGRVLGDADSYDHFLHVEAYALDRVVNASYPQGDTDADRLAEVRDILAALRIVNLERQARRKAAREAAGR